MKEILPRTEEKYEAMRIAKRNKIHLAAIKLLQKRFAATVLNPKVRLNIYATN